jgi:D-alanyl-D-alanine carboxypeptidase
MSRLALRSASAGVLIALAIAGGACQSGIASKPNQPVAGSPAAVSRSAPASTSGASPSQGFVGGVYRIGPTLRGRLQDRNRHPGCPVGIDDLRHVEVSYWDFRGRERSGTLVVHETVARDVLWVFRQLFDARFPIHRIALPPRYRPPRPEDRLSTGDLTAAFNCRPATDQPGSISQHSYGWAIDINPLLNPYVRSDGSVLRRAVKPYLDRSRHAPGMIHPGDVVVRSFARIGWEWGGDWTTIKDYMHFSLTGR